MNKPASVILTEKQLRTWGTLVLEECGAPEDHIGTVLDVLISAHLHGVDTHGINLLPGYAKRTKFLPPRPIKMLKDQAAACLIDGGHNYGAVTSMYAMERVMEKSAKYGLGIALVKNSNHFGAAGCYTRYAAEKGYIGFCSTTALVDLAPWGSLDVIAGKNPFSISFPGEEFPVVLDISCSVAARQKVMMHAREGWPIPEGWALDKDGQPTTDAQKALEGVFLPMGGHKGIGIAIMIEYLIGALCQGGYSYEITAKNVVPGPLPTRIGHIFMAINPSFFLSKEELVQQTREFSRRFHACRCLPGVKKLYLPGELEYETFLERKKNGIPVAKTVIKKLDEYADEIGIVHICDIPA